MSDSSDWLFPNRVKVVKRHVASKLLCTALHSLWCQWSFLRRYIFGQATACTRQEHRRVNYTMHRLLSSAPTQCWQGSVLNNCLCLDCGHLTPFAEPFNPIAMKQMTPFDHALSFCRTLCELKLLCYFHHGNVFSILVIQKPNAYQDLKDVYLIQELMELCS